MITNFSMEKPKHFDPLGFLVVLIALFWTTGLSRPLGGKTSLVETDVKEKNLSVQEFSILLEKLIETKEGNEFMTISSSRGLGMLEGLLDRMMRFLRGPGGIYRRNYGQTYHGLRLM